MRQVSTEVSPSSELQVASTPAAALRFARHVHLGQRRKQTGEEFIEHPIAVADLLSELGVGDRVLAAAYLHDAVEKTAIQPPEIARRFGPEIARLVSALSDDPSLPSYAERKRALRRQVLEADGDAVLIYAADRLANMRDWRRVEPDRRPACAQRLGTHLDERLALWEEDLRGLTAHDPDLPFLAEIETELRALQAGAA